MKLFYCYIILNKLFVISLLIMIKNSSQIDLYQDNKNDLLNQIMSNNLVANQNGINKKNHNQFQYQNELNKKLALFIDKIAMTGTENTCNSRLMQSDVQSKMRMLKSIISSCPGYCRIAMGQNGHIYGANEFNLDTIWNRVDISDEQLLKNNALLGAYYIKYILSGKYLCTTENGELFSSLNKTKGCLWLSDHSRLISASYKNLNIIVQRNCKLNTIANQFNLNNINSNNQNRALNRLYENDQCTNYINITSGYSSDLQRFFRNCQSSLIKQTNNGPNSNSYNSKNNNNNINNFDKFSLITTKVLNFDLITKPITFTTSTLTSKKQNLNRILFDKQKQPQQQEIFNIFKQITQNNKTFKQTQVKKYYIYDKLQNKHINIPENKLTDKIKTVCKDYLIEEMVYKAASDLNKNKKNNHHFASDLKSTSFFEFDLDNKKIPKLCIEFLISLNQSNVKLINEYLNSQSLTKTNENNKNEYNYIFKTSPRVSQPQSASSMSENNKNIFKKCFKYRNTPNYKKCMNKYYKCYQFNNDLEKLKRCRKKYGITVPPKKKVYF